MADGEGRDHGDVRAQRGGDEQKAEEEDEVIEAAEDVLDAEREVGPSLVIRGWLAAWVWSQLGVWVCGWLLGCCARLVR